MDLITAAFYPHPNSEEFKALQQQAHINPTLNAFLIESKQRHAAVEASMTPQIVPEVPISIVSKTSPQKWNIEKYLMFVLFVLSLFFAFMLGTKMHN